MNTNAKSLRIALVLFFCCASRLIGTPNTTSTYTVTRVIESRCLGLNISGQVIAMDYDNELNSFPIIVTDGKAIRIPTPSFSSSLGSSINMFGQVTGFTSTAPMPSPYRAFLYTYGTLKLIDTLGGPHNSGTALNNLGSVTGASETSNGETHAFLFSAFTGKVKDLGTLGGSYSIGRGINDLGHVTGYSDTSTGESFAFVYSDGKMTNLGGFDGQQSWAYSINNWGQVTGGSMVDPEQGFYHAFIYTSGVMKDLGTLGAGCYSDGVSINNLGQVTGISYISDGSQHGFLYTNGVMYDLNDLLAAQDKGWTITAGTCINDRGQILCDAFNSEGYSRSVILTPVRESSSVRQR